MKIILHLILLTGLAFAKKVDYIGSACLDVSQLYDFGCPHDLKVHHVKQADPKCVCAKNSFLETIVGCSVNYGPQKNLSPDQMEFPLLDEYCGRHIDQIQQYIEKAHSLKRLESNRKKNVIDNDGILLDKAEVAKQAAATHTSDRMVYWDFVFAAAPVGYFLGIFLVKGVFNTMQHATLSVYQKLVSVPVSRKLRKHLFLPATGHSKVRGPNWFPMSIPLRLEFLVVAGYVIFSLLSNFVAIWVYYPNPHRPTDAEQWEKYLGRRSGFLALGSYDLLLMFAGRNNIFIWLTGWDFSVFNLYHRWTARMAVFHVLVHTIAYGLTDRDFTEVFMRWGEVGTILFGLLAIHSVKYLRDVGYETFFALHIVMAAFALPAAWIHVRGEGIQFFYAGITVWSLDRVVRILRIIISGVTAKAQVNLVNDEVLRLEIEYNSKAWKWYPGCYVFVHLANCPLEFWQSHPFTALPHHDGFKRKLVLYARVRRGLTRRLALEAVNKAKTKMVVPVLLDGPYGHKAPIHQYNTVVFIAGGIGVTATLAYALDLAKRQSSKTERILFVWAVRNHQGTSFISSELEEISQNPRVEVHVYVTSEGVQDENVQEYIEEQKLSRINSTRCNSVQETPNDSAAASTVLSFQEKSKDIANVNVSAPGDDRKDSSNLSISHSYNRPDVASIISNEINSNRGSVAVMVCGPGPMNDSVRAAVVQNVDTPTTKVDYFEEAFAW